MKYEVENSIEKGDIYCLTNFNETTNAYFIFLAIRL